MLTLLGNPTVTVPFVLETSTSLDVPLIPKTAPVVKSARVTLPFETTKSPLLKLATPILVSEASSPAIVIVLSATVVLIPSPAAQVSVSPKLTALVLPVSEATLIKLLSI